MKLTKRTIVPAAALSLALGLASIDAMAAPPLSVPYTFTSGTAAKASEVNADFQALATAIDNTNAAVSAITASPQTFSQDVTITGNLLVEGQTDLRVQSLGASPAAAAPANRGQLYLDTAAGLLKFSDGSVWRATNARNAVHTAIATTDNSEPVTNGLCYPSVFMLSRRTVSITTTVAGEVRYSYTDNVSSSSSAASSVTVILYMDGVRINSHLIAQSAGPYYASVAISGYKAATAGTHTFTVGVLPGNGCAATQFTMGLGTFFNLEAEQMTY